MNDLYAHIRYLWSALPASRRGELVARYVEGQPDVADDLAAELLARHDSRVPLSVPITDVVDELEHLLESRARDYCVVAGRRAYA